MSGLPAVNSSPPPVTNNAIPEAISVWMGKLVAQHNISGLGKVSDKIKIVFAFVVFCLIAIAVRYLSNAPPSAQEKKFFGSPTPIPDDMDAPETIFSLLNLPGDLKTNIEFDFNNLNQHFDIMLKKLKSHRVSEDELNRFTAHLRNFQARYQDLARDEGCRSYFDNYAHLKKNFLFLVDIMRGIIRVPSDGNCLFSALSESFRKLSLQQDLSGVWNPAFNDPLQLRQAVVAWMREHLSSDNRLSSEICGAINKYKQAKEQFDIPELEGTIQHLEKEGQTETVKQRRQDLQKLKEELEILSDDSRKIEKYLERVDQPGFFASDAEIYAFCKMLNVKITVRKEYEGQIMEEFDLIFNETAPIAATLLHRNEDHFNWISSSVTVI